MTNQCIAQTPSAFGSPLLIEGLLESRVNIFEEIAEREEQRAG
jgi:hypothetical protein